jgi:hypothetical protein
MFRILDQGKLVEIQRIQNPNQRNAGNLNTVRREASRHFRNKKKAYLEAKIDELETNSKKKISENCIEETRILRRVNSQELI